MTVRLEALDSYTDARLPYRLIGVTGDDLSTSCFSSGTFTQHWDRFRHFKLENNMPPRRSSATARAAAVAAAPMTAAAVEQLIEARVFAALANHENLRNSTKGVVVLVQWFQKIESVFHISNCTMENQVQFATCTFLGNALTWWNSHMNAITQDVAYAMDWKKLKKMMTIKYYPRELALMHRRMFPEESDEVEKYVGGLPNMIRGNMDQKVLTISERQAEHKRKLKFNVRNNQGYQKQNKRQNTRRAYTVGPDERREYTGSLPSCTKCNYNHKGPCAPRCNKCKKISHLARDYRSFGPISNNNNRGNTKTTQNVVTSYECGVQGHFKKDCPKLKNGNLVINVGMAMPQQSLCGGQCGNKPGLQRRYDFDVIIGMDWLSKYHAIIDCAEKIVRIPWGNETLIIHGDGSNQGNGTRLNIILCTKTQKYWLKGHHVFLAHVTTKETEDKLGEK
ncbi:reverse transcriptase domain-containing protein [Tanacetum coccineum]